MVVPTATQVDLTVWGFRHFYDFAVTRPLSSSSCKCLRNHAVVGEFLKPIEFLSFWSLIPSRACATFLLFFCIRSSPLSGLFSLVASKPLLPSPS